MKPIYGQVHCKCAIANKDSASYSKTKMPQNRAFNNMYVNEIYCNTSLAITSFCISEVPSPMVQSLASL